MEPLAAATQKIENSEVEEFSIIMRSSEILLISDGAARPPREEHCIFQAVLGGEYDD